MSGGAIFMIIICAMFPTLIIVALIVKLIEVRKASRWPSVEGKVIANGVESIQNRPRDPHYDFGDTEILNEPRVEYEYHVDGKRFRSKRITIGEKTTGEELEQILARYPLGTKVTVYYDPAKPNNAVLERELPAGVMAAGVGCLMLLFVGGPMTAIIAYYYGVDWLRAHIPVPQRAPFVAAASGFGFLALLFAIAYSRMMFAACRWPIATGKIVSTEVESYYPRVDADNDSASRLHYKPSIVYQYEVNGRELKGDRLRLGLKISSTSEGLAKKSIAKYPVGTIVKVYYNPKSPGESVLNPYSHGHFLLWLIPIIMFWLAWAVATGTI